jgi:hypothetical protein
MWGDAQRQGDGIYALIKCSVILVDTPEKDAGGEDYDHNRYQARNRDDYGLWVPHPIVAQVLGVAVFAATSEPVHAHSLRADFERPHPA